MRTKGRRRRREDGDGGAESDSNEVVGVGEALGCTVEAVAVAEEVGVHDDGGVEALYAQLRWRLPLERAMEEADAYSLGRGRPVMSGVQGRTGGAGNERTDAEIAELTRLIASIGSDKRSSTREWLEKQRERKEEEAGDVERRSECPAQLQVKPQTAEDPLEARRDSHGRAVPLGRNVLGEHYASYSSPLSYTRRETAAEIFVRMKRAVREDIRLRDARRIAALNEKERTRKQQLQSMGYLSPDAAIEARLQRQRQWRLPWPSSSKAASIIPAAWKRKFEAVAAALSRSPTVRGIIGLARAAYRKLVGPTRAEKCELECRATEDRHKRAQSLVRVCVSLAKFLAARRRADRRLATKALAARVASTLLAEQSARVTALILWRRKAKHARVIQRCWRQTRHAKTAHREGKVRVMELMARMTIRLECQASVQCEQVVARLALCEATAQGIVLECRKRLAARLVQRVWRGYRARKRVFAMLAWRRKREMREKVRARARAAKEALLSPTREALAQRKQLKTREASRKQRTPFVFPAGFQREQREAVYAAAHWKAHATSLAPLQFTSPPPRVSSLTRAKTQRVPFSKFERMRDQRARVNMDNVWVAIPVAHAPAASSPPPGRSRQRRSRFLETRYDWVPAALLHLQQEPPQGAGAGGEERGQRAAVMDLLLPSRPLAS